jgi:hypothetical protein
MHESKRLAKIDPVQVRLDAYERARLEQIAALPGGSASPVRCAG